MGSIKAQVTLQHNSGLAEDACVNVLAVETPGAASGAPHAEIAAAIADFYRLLAPANAEILGEYLGTGISRVAGIHTVDLYDIDGKLSGTVPHGSPIHTTPFGIPAAASPSGLPEEVAAVITLRGQGWQTAAVEVPDGADANSLKDRPKQRRSGRMYFGPLNQSAGSTVSSYHRPTTSFLSDLRQAINELQAALILEGCYLSVWSRADSALYRVTHVQTDNAWDTQRRRGVDPTARSTDEVYTP